MSEVVLDASALLAILNDEPGADAVLRHVTGDARPAISAVNLAEVVTKLVDKGESEEWVRDALGLVATDVVEFGRPLALTTGFLRATTRSAGLSLGDRACLALAMELGVPALTADRSWAGLGLPVEVVVVR